MLDQIEAAVRASLVREIRVGHFQFAHALVQQALYDDLGATRRSLHHRQLAIARREADRATSPPPSWRRTGRRQDATTATVSPSGHDAEATRPRPLSPEEAIRWYTTALDAIDANDPARCRRPHRCSVARNVGPTRTLFRQTLLDAAALAERMGDDDGLVRAALRNNRGGAGRAGAVDTERVAVLERALEVVGTDDSPERARLLATLAIELSHGAEWERRLALADEAVACARRLGDEVTLLRVLLHTTEATRLPPTLDQRIVDTEEMFDIAKRLGDPVLLGIAALREALCHDRGRRVRPSRRGDVGARGRRPPRPVPPLEPTLPPRRARGRRGPLRARPRAGGRGARRGRQRGRRVLAVYGATTGQVLWDMGALASMTPALEQTSRAHPGVTGFRGSLGCAYFDAGRLDDARAILRHEVETRFSEHPFNPLWLITISEFASLCIALGEVEAAPMLYEILEPWRGRANSSVVSINGLVTESLAGLALTARDFDRAERDASEALEQAARVGARVSATRHTAGCRRACSRRAVIAAVRSKKHDSSRPKQRR